MYESFPLLSEVIQVSPQYNGIQETVVTLLSSGIVASVQQCQWQQMSDNLYLYIYGDINFITPSCMSPHMHDS